MSINMLRDKVAIVTGASSGDRRATASPLQNRSLGRAGLLGENQLCWNLRMRSGN
jgi:hypothetical protein